MVGPQLPHLTAPKSVNFIGGKGGKERYCALLTGAGPVGAVLYSQN